MNAPRQTLNSPTRLALGSLLVCHALLLSWGAFRHSPTVDEAAHLPAGIHHWLHGDFELFRVNPPLPRMIAALPVLLCNPKLDWTALENAPAIGARADFDVGRDFIHANGFRSFRYYALGRLACIPFSLLGGIVCFQWARELYGSRSGLLACCLWTFSPHVIAHGQLITPDVPAASCGVLASYCFARWLRMPTWPMAMAAGLSLGLAELTKTTWILCFLLWPGLWVWQRFWVLRFSAAAIHGLAVKPIHDPMPHQSDVQTPTLAADFSSAAVASQDPSSFRLGFKGLIVILAIALYTLNLGYGFAGTLTPLKNYTFVSESLSGHKGARWSDNVFRGTFLGDLPMPLPTQYILGIDFQKKEFENKTMSYLRGEMRRGGWWYYYLYSLLVKAPLGMWVLAILALAMRILRPIQLPPAEEAVLLVPMIALFILVSAQTGINKHLRYVLPAFPFAYIWISQVAAAPTAWATRAAGCALSSAIASTLWIYPHTLAYFNEAVGGPRQGHWHLINSNIDWGQDLLFLKDRLTERQWGEDLRLVFWSRYDPSITGLHFQLPPPKEEVAIDADTGLPRDLPPGAYAISINHLHGYPFAVPNGRGERRPAREHAFSYLMRLKPEFTAGYSMYVFRVPEAPDDSPPSSE